MVGSPWGLLDFVPAKREGRMKMNVRPSVVASVLLAGMLLFGLGVFVGRNPLRRVQAPRASVSQATGQPSLSTEEREKAKALDDDVAKQCQTNRDECWRAQTMLLLEAQVRLAEWGSATKFTAEPDSETTSAIRLYQQRNGLPATGKLDGVTVVRMDADQEAVAAYPFTLPPFYFPEKWPQGVFLANGVFRDTSSGDVSGPIEIECYKEWHLCLEEESETLTPGVAKMIIKEWTNEHIIAEAVAACYTNQLRIERASRNVVHTGVKTHSDKSCKSYEKFIGKPFPDVHTEVLVDGVHAQIERSQTRAATVHRVKLFSDAAQLLIGADSG